MKWYTFENKALTSLYRIMEDISKCYDQPDFVILFGKLRAQIVGWIWTCICIICLKIWVFHAKSGIF